MTGSKLFDTLMVFLEEFFEKVDLDKKSADDKKIEKLPSMQGIIKPEHYLWYLE